MSVIKSILKFALKAFAFLILIGVVVIAPLVYGTTKEPLIELASPSSLTGKDTLAKFFAGATADNGASYANSFAYEQAIDQSGIAQLFPLNAEDFDFFNPFVQTS